MDLKQNKPGIQTRRPSSINFAATEYPNLDSRKGT